MKLYLIRHGDAEIMMNDAIRPLSPQGQQEAKNAGRYLLKVGANLDFIYHSTLSRSRETAEQLAHILSAGALLVERDGLCPGDNPTLFAQELQAEKRSGVIVGHLPFVHILASELLMNPRELLPIRYTTGTIVSLERGEYGEWSLRAFTPAKIIAKLTA